jgi:hypothetical protein
MFGGKEPNSSGTTAWKAGGRHVADGGRGGLSARTGRCSGGEERRRMHAQDRPALAAASLACRAQTEGLRTRGVPRAEVTFRSVRSRLDLESATVAFRFDVENRTSMASTWLAWRGASRWRAPASLRESSPGGSPSPPTGPAPSRSPSASRSATSRRSRRSSRRARTTSPTSSSERSGSARRSASSSCRSPMKIP